jgi:acylphosphatase
MKTLIKSVLVIVSGRVIGVFFRAWTKTQADSLGLRGFIKNAGDHVEAVFQGDEKKINKMLELLKVGPPPPALKKSRFLTKKVKEVFRGFEIRR